MALPVEYNNGTTVAMGTVWDMTTAGAFVASERNGAPRGTRVPPGSSLDQLLQVSDQFLLTFVESTVMKKRSVLATVRWRGISGEHGCHGYGVQYERE